MIENLKLFMKKNYDYKMTEFKVCTCEKKKSKFLFLPLYIYIVILLGYLLQVLSVIPDIYNNPVIVVVIGVLIGMYQVVLIQKSKVESLIITPEYMINSFGKKTFVVVNYNQIRKFRYSDKTGITISDRKSEISISPVYYESDLAPIIEILEAKGKTFDKTREFMKRPVKIRIINGEIIVKDIKQEESTTEKLVGEYYEKYKMLTPGYIRDIIFLNSIVDEIFTTDNNLILKLDKIEVKEGHPENTGFDSIIASDCITIFEDLKIKNVSIKKVRDRNAKEEVLPNDFESIINNVEKGVIANWKYRKSGIDLHFAAGTNMVKVSFDYKEVIIGWNSFK